MPLRAVRLQLVGRGRSLQGIKQLIKVGFIILVQHAGQNRTPGMQIYRQGNAAGGETVFGYFATLRVLIL